MPVSTKAFAGIARWGKIALLSARIACLLYFLMLGKGAKRAVLRYEFELSDRAVQVQTDSSWKKKFLEKKPVCSVCTIKGMRKC